MEATRAGLMISGAVIAWLLPSTMALSQPAASGQPDFRSVIQTHSRPLSAITSDGDAVTLFSSSLGPALNLKDSASILAGKQTPARQPGTSSSDGTISRETIMLDVKETALRLTAGLATWRIATAVKEAADAGDRAKEKTVWEDAMGQQKWLREKGAPPALDRALELTALLASIPAVQTIETAGTPEYARYAAFLDQFYPRLTGSEDSWLAAAEREGSSGIHRRLTEYWKTPGNKAEPDDVFISRYFHIRLQPVIAAHVMALATRVETDAEGQTRDAWTRLSTWRDRMRELKGLTRLCGTWQWTVHNHTNHQDHKMVMVFPPSPAESVPGSPARIVVLGDGVYLRWEFQEGYQEDSLLFTGKGERLEGTFINSAGAWGSITGKRVQPCPKQ